MISNNLLCRSLFDCCENHSNCSCLCQNLNLIYFNMDAELRKQCISSVDAVRYARKKEHKGKVLYLVEIKSGREINITKKDIIKKLTSSIKYIENNITKNYTYRFFLVISDNNHSSSIKNIREKLKILAKGLDTPEYRIGCFTVQSRKIKCSETDSLLY